MEMLIKPVVFNMNGCVCGLIALREITFYIQHSFSVVLSGFNILFIFMMMMMKIMIVVMKEMMKMLFCS